MKLVSVGESTFDYYPAQNAYFVGGISLNFAVQAKRMGADDVSLVSRVGTDAAGRQILAKLAAEGVNAQRVVTLDGKSAECAIEVRPNGERIFPPNSYHQHVLTGFRPNSADLTFIQQHNVVVSLYDQSRPNDMFDDVMLRMPFDGVRVADFGDWHDYRGGHAVIPPYLNHIDLAFISGNVATIEYFEHFVQQVPCLIVVTLGANGSAALTRGQTLFQSAMPVEQIADSTGCGDAFQAAFTVNYLRNRHIEYALYQGSLNASRVIQHFGAI